MTEFVLGDRHDRVVFQNLGGRRIRVVCFFFWSVVGV